MSILFRKFNGSEIEKITDLMQKLNSEDPEEMPLTKEKINEFFSILDKPEFTELFVIEIDLNIVGYGVLSKYFSTEYGGMCCEIDELYIEKEFRSLGIGSLFIKWLEDYALNIGLKAITLHTTRSNEAAKKLYSKLSYTSIERTLFIKDLK
jgi:GNAT superfamily N-acetyltransferase